ncbi:hypothetical protein DKZ21_00530 [Limosilactobacillus reuteri]|nr:hypothetical protein [Limosilactobacillus reuteri]PWT34117.1 hypothetical protein DKZ21_00530 [Limosilactobacillus reuteri]PWT45549.1 hypothetical protein DKZ25_00530 [Limosilactobacillus reuteri]
MPKAKLEKELKPGIARFIARGRASISSDTFPAQTTESKSGWVYKRVGFPVKIGDSNSIYVQMMGGYSKRKPVVHVFNKDTNQHMELDWDLRDNEDALKNVAEFSFINVALERDEKGKLIRKRFLSELDTINYMNEHLHDGQEIYVSGNVEYQRYDGKISRSFNVTNIGLYDGKDNEEVEEKAEMRQTYLLESTALPRDWEKTLKERNEIVVNAFVPQYVGKEIKKTLAFPQQFTIQTTEDKVDMMTKAIETLFKVKKGVVREIGLKNNIVHGYEKSTGKIQRSKQVMELIQLGIMTEEQIENEETIGNRSVDKVIFKMPLMNVDGEKSDFMLADKYSPEALIIVEDDEDIEENTSVFNEDDNKDEEANADAMFGGLFE